MIRFRQIIQEEFLSGDNVNGEYHEIYINPTNSEIKELGDNYRAIIDIKNKNIYVTDSEMLHNDMVKTLKQDGYLQDFNYTRYWNFGDNTDRFITLTIDDMGYDSDSLTDILLKVRGSSKEEQIKSNMEELVNSDFSWIKGKWFDQSKFQKGLDEVREML